VCLHSLSGSASPPRAAVRLANTGLTAVTPPSMPATPGPETPEAAQRPMHHHNGGATPGIDEVAVRKALKDYAGMLDADQRKKTLRDFAAMDRDQDGKLSSDEFRENLGLLGVDLGLAQILFNSFDHNGDGFVDKSEFLASMAVMLHPEEHEEQVAMAFNAYDLNKDGKLTVDELQHVIEAMFSTMAKMGIREEGEDAKLAAVELFRHMDAAEKGYVTREDYQRLAANNPELLKRIGLGNSTQQARSVSRLRTASVSARTPAELHASTSASPSRPLSRPHGPAGSLYGVPPAHRPAKKKGRGAGTTVSFGHENWELVVQMMLAIRLSVGRAIEKARVAASSQRSTLSCGGGSMASGSSSSTRGISGVQLGVVGPAGIGGGGGGGSAEDLSEVTTANHAVEPWMYKDIWKTTIPGNRKGKPASIAFKDYAPLVFRRIRSLFGVGDREYMLSLGPEQILGELLLGTLGSLSELFSEGKSGSFFYFSNDGRYLIKTIPHRELKSLIRLLRRYVEHIQEYPHTLLPRFMGAHRIAMPGGREVHFVVMTNVFSAPRVIHERYDLKGSTHGRTAGKALDDFPDLVRKDLDVRRGFGLRPSAKESMSTQIARDLDFLREVRTMDYSLLVGVHYPTREGAGSGGSGASDGGGIGMSQIGLQLSSSASLPSLDELEGEDGEGGGRRRGGGRLRRCSPVRASFSPSSCGANRAYRLWSRAYRLRRSRPHPTARRLPAAAMAAAAAAAAGGRSLRAARAWRSTSRRLHLGSTTPTARWLPRGRRPPGSPPPRPRAWSTT
jgi:Ca2+-binding EF-hand superfamily protein